MLHFLLYSENEIFGMAKSKNTEKLRRFYNSLS